MDFTTVSKILKDTFKCTYNCSKKKSNKFKCLSYLYKKPLIESFGVFNCAQQLTVSENKVSTSCSKCPIC